MAIIEVVVIFPHRAMYDFRFIWYFRWVYIIGLCLARLRGDIVVAILVVIYAGVSGLCGICVFGLFGLYGCYDVVCFSYKGIP